MKIVATVIALQNLNFVTLYFLFIIWNTPWNSCNSILLYFITEGTSYTSEVWLFAINRLKNNSLQ